MDESGDVEIMMGGNTCTVCTHEAKEAIDQAIVAGGSRRTIANQYGVSDAAVGRHRENHLPATLVKAAEAQDEEQGTRLLEQAQGLVDEALASIERSKGGEVVNERDVLAGVREARNGLEFTGRITGELRAADRDNAPQSAVEAIIKLASALSEAQLRGMAAGEVLDPAIEVARHVIEPECLKT